MRRLLCVAPFGFVAPSCGVPISQQLRSRWSGSSVLVAVPGVDVESSIVAVFRRRRACPQASSSVSVPGISSVGQLSKPSGFRFAGTPAPLLLLLPEGGCPSGAVRPAVGPRGSWPPGRRCRLGGSALPTGPRSNFAVVGGLRLPVVTGPRRG